MKRLGKRQVQLLLVLSETPQHRVELVAKLRAQGWVADAEAVEWGLDGLITRNLAVCTDLHTYALGDSAELPETLAYARERQDQDDQARADATARVTA